MDSYITISVEDTVLPTIGLPQAPLVYIYHGNCGNLQCDMMVYNVATFGNVGTVTAQRKIHFRAVSRMTYYIAVSTTDIDLDPTMSIHSTTLDDDDITNIGSSSSCESARNLTTHCFDDEIDCDRRAEHFLPFEVSDAHSGGNNIVVPECTQEEEPSAGNGEEEGDDNSNSSVAWFLLEGVGLGGGEHIVLELWYSCPAIPSEPSIRITLYQGSDCENLVCRNDIVNTYQECFDEGAPTNDDTIWFGSQGCYCHHRYEIAAEIGQQYMVSLFSVHTPLQAYLVTMVKDGVPLII